MRLLLLGKNGQVGWELQRALAPLGELIALDRSGTADLCGDLGDLAGLTATVRAVAPQVIVNAAAWTDVDAAEHDPEAATRINAEAPGVLAAEAARLGAWLVHYSSDYVYSGAGTRPWTETDTPAPLSAYGRSKLAGDEAVANSGARALIFRTSWVHAARGRNFLRSILQLARSRDILSVVNDQFGAPTGADLIADVTAHALIALAQTGEASRGGLYHLAAAGETTWWEYARLILAEAQQAGASLRVTAEQVTAVPSEAYPRPAPRPRNSRLSVARLEHAFGLRMPDWRDGVRRTVRELLT
ncbi:MAG: dTDP-4-dehydrorhamnose reductase [Gammaproteobacteria bacterium]|nr:dTDP-4-dehydrorhamnose reductase [Gammaproteobacteria bacterium]